MLACSRNYFLHISDPRVNTLLSVVCGVIAIPTLDCFVCSAVELGYAYLNRRGEIIHVKWLATIGKDEIKQLLIKHDGIEIKLLSTKDSITVVKIGNSGTFKTDAGRLKLYDKKYYINDEWFETIEQLELELDTIFQDDVIIASSISGGSAKYYRDYL